MSPKRLHYDSALKQKIMLAKKHRKAAMGNKFDIREASICA